MKGLSIGFGFLGFQCFPTCSIIYIFERKTFTTVPLIGKCLHKKILESSVGISV